MMGGQVERPDGQCLAHEMFSSLSGRRGQTALSELGGGCAAAIARRTGRCASQELEIRAAVHCLTAWKGNYKR